MHHYRCKNAYISSTASERIINTLEFSPQNLPMPKISSTDQLLMAAHDMIDGLKHPHPDVPFATIGDDTTTTLAQLAKIFKNKFQNPLAPEISQTPIKAAENKQPAALIQQILTSPMKHNYQTRSQNQVSPSVPTNINASKSCHNFRGWSHRQQGTPHLRGCRRGCSTFLQEIFQKTISYIWAVSIST
jgi:hypothetical protein